MNRLLCLSVLYFILFINLYPVHSAPPVKDKEYTQAEAIQKIKDLGGTFNLALQLPDDPTIPDQGAVKSVYFMKSPVKDSDLEVLKGLTSIEYLFFAATNVDGTGLAQLKSLKRLKRLHLGHNKLSREGLDNLKSFPNLEYLHLYQVPTAPEQNVIDLKQIQSLTRLRELTLSRMNLNDANLKYLKGMHQLELLRLDHNPIGDSGLKHLHGLFHLKELSLEKTLVTKAAVEQFRVAHPDCLIRYIRPLTAADQKRVDHFTKLGAYFHYLNQDPYRIVVSTDFYGQRADNADLSGIELFPDLKSLTLSNTQVTDASLILIGRMKKLKSFTLNHCTITENGLTHLSKMHHLDVLNLMNQRINNAGLAQLEGLNNLKRLYLRNTWVSKSGIKQFQERVPDCHIIHK